MRSKRWLLPALAAALALSWPAAPRAAHEAPVPELAIPRATVFTPWKGYVRVFGGHDDNPAVAGEESGYSGTKASPYFGVVAQASWTKVNVNGWSGGINGSLGRVLYTTGEAEGATDAPNEYNMTAFNPQAFVYRAFAPFGRPARLEASADFRAEWIGIDEISGQHSRFVVNASAFPMPGLSMRAGFRMTSYDSEVEFPDEDVVAQRDGMFKRLDIEATYNVPKLRGRVHAVYEMSNSDADGPNFDYDGNLWKFRFDNRLANNLWADLSLAKDARKYNEFVSSYLPAPGRKVVDILDGKAKLMWKFAPHWVADLNVKTEKIDAETPTFRARRKIGGIGVTYSFSGGLGGR